MQHEMWYLLVLNTKCTWCTDAVETLNRCVDVCLGCLGRAEHVCFSVTAHIFSKGVGNGPGEPLAVIDGTQTIKIQGSLSIMLWKIDIECCLFGLLPDMSGVRHECSILRTGNDSLLCAGFVTSQGYQKHCGDDRRSKNHNFCDVFAGKSNSSQENSAVAVSSPASKGLEQILRDRATLKKHRSQ